MFKTLQWNSRVNSHKRPPLVHDKVITSGGWSSTGKINCVIMDDDTMSFGVSLTLILSLTPVKSDKLNKMELL